MKLPSLETLELIAGAGFEFIVVDLEHSPLPFDFAYQAIVVAQGLGMAAIVRVPDRSGSHIQRLLDAGADGLLVPQVNTAEVARQSVSQMVFSPPEREAWARHRVPGDGVSLREPNTWVAATRSCAPCNSRIARRSKTWTPSSTRPASTPPSSAWAISPSPRGCRPPPTSFLTLTDKLLAATASRGLPCGTAVGDAASAAAAFERCFSFVMVSNDAGIFGQAAAELGAAVSAGLTRMRESP